jgi:WD40 repeat protein
MSDWSGVATIGFNVSQAQGNQCQVGTWSPVGNGIRVNVSNPGSTSLRVQLSGANGATDPNASWCAILTSFNRDVSISWGEFTTACWNGAGTAYNMQPLANVQVYVPGNNTAATAFNYCVNSIGIQTGVLSQPYTFAVTPGMKYYRASHTATLLPDGKVLIAGGEDVTYILETAELYDQSSGTFTATGSMKTGREEHTATLLPNGKVLIVGGWAAPSALSSVELYDPSTGTFSPTGSLGEARHAHTATLLPNGKVLIAGGYDNNAGGVMVSRAELYDPDTGSFSFTGAMVGPRNQHTATLLPNGKVLIAAGSNMYALASAELYDPATGAFTATGSLAFRRITPTATLLAGGLVLIANGSGDINGGSSLKAELYDPVTGEFSTTGATAQWRSEHTATILPNGKVLVAGGSSTAGQAELYDPSTSIFTIVGSLVYTRYAHTATLLPNGRVLLVGGKRVTTSGGVDTTNWLASAEIFY